MCEIDSTNTWSQIPQFPFSNLHPHVLWLPPSLPPPLLREPVCQWWSWRSCLSAPCAWRGWTSRSMASSPLSATTAFTASVSSGGKMPRKLYRHTLKNCSLNYITFSTRNLTKVLLSICFRFIVVGYTPTECILQFIGFSVIIVLM